MSKSLIGVLAAAGIVLFLGGTILFSFLGFQNESNAFEQQIIAKYTDNQNVYDNGWKEVKEKAQIPAQYAGDLQKIYGELVTGRQGSPNELFRMITEANPTLDSKLYVEIQQSIEGFRQSFKQTQTELISIKQTYQTFLSATTTGRLFNTISHYPHIDMNKYDIVTSSQTDKAFETKKADELDLKR